MSEQEPRVIHFAAVNGRGFISLEDRDIDSADLRAQLAAVTAERDQLRTKYEEVYQEFLDRRKRVEELQAELGMTVAERDILLAERDQARRWAKRWKRVACAFWHLALERSSRTTLRLKLRGHAHAAQWKRRLGAPR